MRIPAILFTFLLAASSFSLPSIITKKSYVPEKADQTILAIFAHPDDEILVSPLLAKYARQGVHVYLAIATSGEQGVMPHAHIPAGDSLRNIRSEEARCAARELHINPPILLGLGDGKLSTNESYAALHRKIDSLFAALHPDVVLTWGPEGGYGHPDHRAVSNIVTEVFQQGGKNQPGKLLYGSFPTEALNDLPKFKTFVGTWLSTSFHTVEEKYLTYRVPYDDLDLKTVRASYACHRSQWTPEMEDDIFLLLGKAGKVAFLRPWTGGGEIKKDLFQ